MLGTPPTPSSGCPVAPCLLLVMVVVVCFLGVFCRALIILAIIILKIREAGGDERVTPSAC